MRGTSCKRSHAADCCNREAGDGLPGKIERKKPEKKKVGLAKEEGGTAAER